MTAVTTTPRGRPREFDTDVVLARVVQLFWDKGYEATSVADIVEVTGLNKSSIYNTFGSKEQLFERALENYVETRVAMLTATLVDGHDGLDDIDNLMNFMELEVASDTGGRGCLAVNTSTELGYRDDQTQTMSRMYRAAIREAFTAALLRAEELGEIEVGHSSTYREVLLLWMLGMAVAVRGGADPDEIKAQFAAGRALLTTWRTT